MTFLNQELTQPYEQHSFVFRDKKGNITYIMFSKRKRLEALLLFDYALKKTNKEIKILLTVIVIRDRSWIGRKLTQNSQKTKENQRLGSHPTRATTFPSSGVFHCDLFGSSQAIYRHTWRILAPVWDFCGFRY